MRLKAYQNQRSFVPVVLLVVNCKRYTEVCEMLISSFATCLAEEFMMLSQHTGPIPFIETKRLRFDPF